MRKYSLFVGLLGVTLILAPMVSLICLLLFLSYRFIFRMVWRADVLVMKIALSLGTVFFVLGYFVTGVPHVVQEILIVFREVLALKLNPSDNLYSWLIDLTDFWAWSVGLFSFSGLIYASKDYKEVMIQRETDRLANRFTENYARLFR